MIVSQFYEDLSVLHDNHQYTNIRYPFPFDPPYLPHDIPCGAYVNYFVYEKDDNAPKSLFEFWRGWQLLLCLAQWTLYRIQSGIIWIYCRVQASCLEDVWLVLYHKNIYFKKVYHFVHITACYVYSQKLHNYIKLV